MKKSLIILLSVIIAMHAVSCAEDLITETAIIDKGGSEEEGSSGNPYWDWADKYPGVVSANIERVYDVEVVVKGGYEPIAYAPDSPVLQSTGLYVASGENVEIVIPDNTIDLQCQIGMGYTLASGQLRMRYDDVVTKKQLNPGQNTISSYFGGYLYFFYPVDKVASSNITVKVGGVVESYNYMAGETNPREWTTTMIERASLLANPSQEADSMAFLQWTELISDKVILTAGVSEMSAMTDPNGVLEYYGKIADAYYNFGGYDPSNQPPMRVYSDIQLPDANQTVVLPTAKIQQYGGYPIGFLRGESDIKFVDEKKLINTNILRVQNDDGTSWFNVFYGFGEAVKSQWQDSELLLEPSLNIGYYHYARTISVWPEKIINFSDNVKKLNTDYARTLNNKDNGIMYGHGNSDIRTTMLKQLADYLGWRLFSYVSERARELQFKLEADELLGGQAACDFFAMSACEYADRNLLPFFRRWHFPCSTIAIKYMNQFQQLTANEQFWTAYDATKEPSFDKKTPNKSLNRPSWKINFQMYDGDDKENWYLSGIGLDYEKYNDPVNPDSVMAMRGDGTPYSGNSIDNPAWKNVFDGNTSNQNGLLGHMQPVTHSPWAHIPQYTMSFIGPPGAGDEYSKEPVTFNTVSMWNVNNYYFTSYIYNIEYWDIDANEWKPTVPSEFKLLYNSNWEFYYFEKEYTTTQLKFKLQPITPGTSGYSITQFNEISFGLVK